MKSLMEEIKALNVFDDTALEGHIVKVNQLIDDRAKTGNKGKEASMDDIKTALAAASNHIQAQLDEIPPMRGVRIEALGADEAPEPDAPASRRGGSEGSTGTEDASAALADAPVSRRGKRSKE